MCWSCKAPPPPTQAPPDLPPEYQESAVENTELGEDAPAEEEATQQEPAEDAPAEQPDEAARAPEAEKTCKELKRGRCKVTKGCAWNERRGCVEVELGD